MVTKPALQNPLWSDDRIDKAATVAWQCYDFRLGMRIEVKKMRDEYEAEIAKLKAQVTELGDSIPKIQETAYHHGFIAGQGLKG